MATDIDASEAHAKRGWMLLQLHRHQDAACLFRDALAADPDNDDAHHGLAACLARLEKFKPALQEMEAAIRLEPNIAHYHAYRAILQYNTKQPRRARASLKTALELDPSDPYGWRCAAHIAQAEGKLREAEQHVRKAMELEPNSVEDFNLLAPMMSGKRDFQASREMLEEALRLEPDNPETHTQMGWLLLPTDHARAEDHFFSALRRDPHLEEARLGMLEAFKARNWLYQAQIRLDFQFRRFVHKCNVVIFLLSFATVLVLMVTLLPDAWARKSVGMLVASAMLVVALLATLTCWAVLVRPFGQVLTLLDRRARLALTFKEKFNAYLFCIFVGGLVLFITYGIVELLFLRP